MINLEKHGVELSDEQIAEFIEVDRTPQTELGKVISKRIVSVVEERGNNLSPFRFKAFENQFRDKKLEIWLISPRGSKTFCGYDCLNDIYVLNGNIYSIPRSGLDSFQKKIKNEGVRTNINFIKAFADLVSSVAEELNGNYEILSIGDIKDWREINLKIPKIVENHIKTKGKEIDIKGSVGLSAEIKLL